MLNRLYSKQRLTKVDVVPYYKVYNGSMSKFSRQFLFLSVMLGMVLNPVLAALNCAANCGKFEQPVLAASTAEPSVELASTMSEHCQRMMQQKQSAELQDDNGSSGSDVELVDGDDNFPACECATSCGASAAALISLLYSPTPMFSHQRTESLAAQTVPVALVRNPYRPPIA